MEANLPQNIVNKECLNFSNEAGPIFVFKQPNLGDSKAALQQAARLLHRRGQEGPHVAGERLLEIIPSSFLRICIPNLEDEDDEDGHEEQYHKVVQDDGKFCGVVSKRQSEGTAHGEQGDDDALQEKLIASLASKDGQSISGVSIQRRRANDAEDGPTHADSEASLRIIHIMILSRICEGNIREK